MDAQGAVEAGKKASDPAGLVRGSLGGVRSKLGPEDRLEFFQMKKDGKSALERKKKSVYRQRGKGKMIEYPLKQVHDA